MKKLMLIVALLSFAVAANAQKSADAIIKAATKAKEACENPKKASNPTTWINYAKINLDAYDAAKGDGWAGGNKTEIQMVMNGVKPIETVNETYESGNYVVDVYPNAKYYYTEAGVLQMIVVKPFIENALENARSAYEKAAEYDVKGTKAKDICEGLGKISENYQTEAYTAYQLGDLALSSKLFDKSAEASATKPLCKIDSATIYNSGLTALLSGNYEVAKERMTKCIELSYLEDGDTYAKLADCEKALKDTVECKRILEEGFSKCPQNQGILIGLINLYLETNDDPERLFSLLDVAKQNEPNNASLYYVEGNIRKQLGDFEKATVAYDKCAEVNPEYVYGHVGKGLMYFDQAVAIQQQADEEPDWRKYDALVVKMDEALESAIPCFEKAFEITNDTSIKTSLGEYLKNIYFRFREKSESYMEAYERYNQFVKDQQEQQ